jgi:hypothetical protein
MAEHVRRVFRIDALHFGVCSVCQGQGHLSSDISRSLVPGTLEQSNGSGRLKRVGTKLAVPEIRPPVCRACLVRITQRTEDLDCPLALLSVLSAATSLCSGRSPTSAISLEQLPFTGAVFWSLPFSLFFSPHASPASPALQLPSGPLPQPPFCGAFAFLVPRSDLEMLWHSVTEIAIWLPTLGRLSPKANSHPLFQLGTDTVGARNSEQTA